MALGDHILVHRLGGLYSHHGIDCGDGSVIHYWGNNAWRSSVVRTSIDRFAGGGSVETRDYGEAAALLRAYAARRAEGPRFEWSLDADWVEQWNVNLNWALDRLRGLPDGPFELDTDVVMARAESRIGEARFDFVFNNCEHFATWCKTGISDSRQVEVLWRVVMGPMASTQRRVGAAVRWLVGDDGHR